MRRLSLAISFLFVIALLLPAENKQPEEAVVFGALDAVAKTVEYADPADVMDFLTSVYAGHGYYEAGGWDEPCLDMPAYGGMSLPAWAASAFVRPVEGRVTSPYGYRQKFGRMHYGIDLAIGMGDTIRAALPGVVERTGCDALGYGHFVIIKHADGVETRYGHLQKPLAMPGQKVEAGEAVALGGNTGRSTGPHLHFETRCQGIPVDPIAFLIFD